MKKLISPLRVMAAALLAAAGWPFVATGQTLQPDFGAPTAPVSVCDGSQVFRIRVIGSSQPCANGTIDIELPYGYTFVNGSSYVAAGTGTVTQLTSTGSQARLQVQNIPASPGITEIVYRAYADCSAIGTATTVESLAKYTLSSPCLGTYAVTSNTFNTQTAALAISSISNGNFSGSIGSTYNRGITITNNGLGTVSQITLKDTIASGLANLGFSVSNGWTVTRSKSAQGNDTVHTYLLSGPSLAQGQSIVLTENLRIMNACFLQSRMYAYFGCAAVACVNNNVTASATAGATVNNSQTANLVIDKTQMQKLACRGTAYEQVVGFSNTGTAALRNLQANIFSSGWSAVPGTQYFNAARTFTSGAQSGFSAIRYKVGAAGAWNVLPLDSVKSFTNQGSAITGMPSSLYFTIPQINPGETIYVSYMERNSPLPGINAGNTMEVSGNLLWYSYMDGCGTRTAPVATFLRDYVQLRINNDVNIPSNMEPGQTYSFAYTFTEANTAIYTYTGADNSYIRFDLILPANVIFTGNASSIYFLKGGSPYGSLTNYSYNAATRTLSVTYPITASFNINGIYGATLVYNDMQLLCGVASTGNTVTFNTYVRSQVSCGNEEQMSTLPTKVGLLCPAPCGPAGGISFETFSFARRNYGSPDNDNNGVADASGVINRNTVKTNYALMGDTLTAQFTGKISVTAASPASGFTYGTAIDTFSSMQTYITNLYGTVQLYAAGSTTPFYSCNNLPVGGGTGNIRRLEFGIAALNAVCPLPAGYNRFRDNDSIVVRIFYRITANPGNTLATVDITNGFGVHSALMTTSAQLNAYTCGSRYSGRLVIVSKGAGNSHGNLTYTSTGNNTVQLQGTNVGFLGPCCVYAGSKPFVYEYRSVSIYDQATFTLPDGYDFVSARVRYQWTTSPANTAYRDVTVTPTNPGATTLIFDLRQLFENGSLPYGDQGSILYFYPTVRPNCAATDKGVGTISIRQIATPGSNFTFPAYTSTHADTIYLNRPKITATVTNNNVIANTNSVSWEVQVANGSPVSAGYVWMGKNTTPSGVTITSVQRLSGSGGTVLTTVSPNGAGIYQLGTFAQTSTYYRITANYSSCVKDSIGLAYWYDCNASNGYPATIAAQPYRQSVSMYVQPQQSSMQLSIVDQPASTPHDLCEQLNYAVEVLNAGVGDGGSPRVTAILPTSGGISYVPGTFTLEYPMGSNTYVSVPDANVVQTGSSLQFNIPASYYTRLTTNQKVKVRFGLRTNCTFTSGQAIRFGASAVSPCGVVSSGIVQQSEKIEMNGVPSTRNLYDLRSYVDTARQSCNSTSDLVTTYRFVLVNQGPLVTSTSDLYSIELPDNWTMDVASINYLRNASGAHYSSTTAGLYYFATGTNLAVGDSIVMTATVRLAGTYAQSLMTGSTDPFIENAILQYTGTCTTSGNTCPSSQAIVSSHNTTRIPYTNSLALNPNVYGTNNTWYGYMFQGSNFQTYKGRVTEGNNSSPNFDENFGGAAVNYSTDACTVYTENFSGRYMLNKWFLPGTYKMTVGGGDGYRFSTDGGNTWIVNRWSTHAYETTEITLNLDGAYNMVLEYFGAVGANRVSYAMETLYILPIHLELFTGNLVSGDMHLQWQVAGNSTAKTFIVERAGANGNYTGIGTVEAGPIGTRQYQFVDADPLTGRSSYRLRMIDENGKPQYSSVIPLMINAGADAGVQVFPSFLTGQTFTVQSARPLSNVKLVITDMNGRLLKTQKLMRLNANDKQVVDGHGCFLVKGIYTVFIESDDLNAPVVRKLIVP